MATEPKSRIEQIGCEVSAWTSDLFAHPFAQVCIILFCVTWFALRLPTDLLTAALSILAITLAQMVLNKQNEREMDAHRRDVAMHAKLDELVHAMKGAREEMVGIEDLDEAEIEELKDHAQEAIEAQGARAGDPRPRATAKIAVERAHAQVKNRAKAKA